MADFLPTQRRETRGKTMRKSGRTAVRESLKDIVKEGVREAEAEKQQSGSSSRRVPKALLVVAALGAVGYMTMRRYFGSRGGEASGRSGSGGEMSYEHHDVASADTGASTEPASGSEMATDTEGGSMGGFGESDGDEASQSESEDEESSA